jgi:hypothetical protein
MKSISAPFMGGCACGAVRYQSAARPVLMLHCHCRDCQRSSGGPYCSFVVVPDDAFKLIQGSPRFYGTPSDAGGKTNRAFCADCGSPLFGKPDAVPGIVAIRTASLDDPSGFELQMDVWTCDAHAWDIMNPSVKKFEKYPA